MAEALRDADLLRGVFGATPGETVALVEYLLAICYATETAPETEGEWIDWVEQRHPLDRAAERLLAAPTTDWDLFDPDTPLGQNSLLAPYIDEHGSGPAQLVLEHVGDYVQFIDHHHLEHPRPLRADEAFRAMLVQHCYGPGIRGRVPGNLPGLGPKLNTLGTCRLATRARVLALGETLGETLRLNLQPVDDCFGTFNTTWTQAGRTRREFTTKPAGRIPDGPADLHTVLGRSILLRPAFEADGTLCVDRVMVGAGELLATPLHANFVQDAIFVGNRTKPQERRPFSVSAKRALWREAHALYSAVHDRDKGTDLYSRLGSASGLRVRLWAVGIASEDNKLLTWIADSFPFVSGREAELREAASTGADLAWHVANALRQAAQEAWKIAYPNPKPADKARQVARFDAEAEHYAATPRPFHRLLDRVADGESADEALQPYAEDVVRTARDLLRKRLDSLPLNSRGFRARAAAEQRFAAALTDSRAQTALQEIARDDHSA